MSLAILAATLATACDPARVEDPTRPGPAPESVTAALEQEFTLRIGQEAAVAGEAIRIRFDAVREDNRCPVDVTCVWAGNARLALLVTAESQTAAAMELNTTLEPRHADVDTYTIRLAALEPQPRSNAAIETGAYRARLVISRD